MAVHPATQTNNTGRLLKKPPPCSNPWAGASTLPIHLTNTRSPVPAATGCICIHFTLSVKSTPKKQRMPSARLRRTHLRSACTVSNTTTPGNRQTFASPACNAKLPFHPVPGTCNNVPVPDIFSLLSLMPQTVPELHPPAVRLFIISKPHYRTRTILLRKPTPAFYPPL